MWHQIRCIVTILFQIGRGVDDEGIVEDLLDIDKFKSRPGYPYADPRYLTLTDCVYDPDPFGTRFILQQRSGKFMPGLLTLETSTWRNTQRKTSRI